MDNLVLKLAVWAAIGLSGLSVLVMAGAGLRSVFYGKVQPLTIGIVAIPGVLVLILRFVMASSATPWVAAGMWTLAIMFGLLVLAMLFTGLRKLAQSAFS